jgi:hypothetical protein
MYTFIILLALCTQMGVYAFTPRFGGLSPRAQHTPGTVDRTTTPHTLHTRTTRTTRTTHTHLMGALNEPPMELCEENAEIAIEEVRQELGTIFGYDQGSRDVGITGG